MKLICMVVGALSTNCYVLIDEQTAAAVVIDPGGDEKELIDRLEAEHLVPSQILITHGHMDHFLAAAKLGEHFGCPVRIHRDEIEYMHSDVLRRTLHAPRVFNTFIEAVTPDLTDGSVIEAGGIRLEAIEVPGHTAHSLCFYEPDEGILFAGDTLFAGSMGRTDLYEGKDSDLIRNIRTRLMALPDETAVFCGHGPSTTIGDERRYNPFVGERAYGYHA